MTQFLLTQSRNNANRHREQSVAISGLEYLSEEIATTASQSRNDTVSAAQSRNDAAAVALSGNYL